MQGPFLSAMDPTRLKGVRERLATSVAGKLLAVLPDLPADTMAVVGRTTRCNKSTDHHHLPTRSHGDLPIMQAAFA
ncbi:MAG: hypothetical protein HY255_02145 [Betaproteobacteria bacterium]|nr:hypothetical protein [Betaproteobacteria bacterium]